MLYYSNYKLPFLIFLDASDKQLRAHITQIQNEHTIFYDIKKILSQEHHPVLFYSRKRKSYKRNYSVANKELLIIIDTITEHKIILCRAKIYIDHKNLTHNHIDHSSARVQC